MICVFEVLFFAIALLNNLLLIIIFAFRKAKNLKAMKTAGYIYFALALPAVWAVIMAIMQNKAINYIIFIIIFVCYLILEFIYDYALKINFRKNWKLLLPYLILYIPMNYGFLVMAWKASFLQGGIIAGLLTGQIILNLISHRSLN